MDTHGSQGTSRIDSERTLRLLATPDAPNDARAFVRAQLPHELDTERLHDVELVTTELMTNAVSHGSNPGDELTLVLQPSKSTLRISVTDPCSKRRSPALLAASSDREFGRGLLTVDRLATQWGDEIVNGKRRVWATIDL